MEPSYYQSSIDSNPLMSESALASAMQSYKQQPTGRMPQVQAAGAMNVPPSVSNRMADLTKGLNRRSALQFDRGYSDANTRALGASEQARAQSGLRGNAFNLQSQADSNNFNSQQNALLMRMLQPYLVQ
jgi:hypothetical protein